MSDLTECLIDISQVVAEGDCSDGHPQVRKILQDEAEDAAADKDEWIERAYGEW